MRVLVVEDDEEILDFLLRVVRSAAWAADGAATGKTGLDAFERKTYDLAILDVPVPFLTGEPLGSDEHARFAQYESSRASAPLL